MLKGLFRREAWRGFLRRRRLALSIIAGCVLLYTIVGFFVAPWVLQRTAPDLVRNNLNAELRLRDVAINPYLLRLRVEGAELDDASGQRVARVEQLLVDFELSSLFHRAWTFYAFHLERPQVFLTRDAAGKLNLADLVREREEPAPPDEPGAGLPRILVHDFAITAGTVHWQDQVPAEPFTTWLGPITAEVRDLSTLASRTGETRIAIATENQGLLTWEGSLNLDPLASSGRANVTQAHLPIANNYLRSQTGLDLPGGTLNLRFRYAIAPVEDGTLGVAIDDLALELLQVGVDISGTAANGPRELVDVAQVALSGGSLRWPERRVAIESLDIVSPHLRLLRDAAGDVSLPVSAGEGGARAAQPQTNGQTAAVADWTVSLDRLLLEDGRVELEDQSVTPTAQVGVHDVRFELRNISNTPGAEFPARLSVNANRGGTLEAEGSVTVLPELLLALDLTGQQIALAGAAPYVVPVLDVDLTTGAVNFQGRLERRPQEPLSFRGDVSVVDFLLSESEEGTRLGSWDKAEVKGIDFSMSNNALEVSQVVFDAPYADILIAEDGSINLGRVRKDKAGAEDPAAARGEEPPERTADDQRESVPNAADESATAPLDVTIGQISVADGAANFTDESLPLPFNAEISDLQGEISTIATDSAAPSKVSLEGKVDEYGVVRVSGSVTPLEPTRNTDVQVVFQNVAVPKFSAYSIPFAGRKLASGKLDLDLGYELKESHLVGKNRMVLRDFKLGEQVPHPDATSLPLGLAVGLLKGPDGTIDLEVPVEGDVDDPEFSYGHLVMKALANLIVKIATSPFAALGNLVGVEGEELDRLHFPAGRADLPPPAMERIDKLAEALSMRPQLTLQITGGYDPQADARALRAARVDGLIEQIMASGESSREDKSFDERRRQAIEQLYRQQIASSESEINALKEAHTQVVTDPDTGKSRERLDELAYSEAQRQALIERQQISQQELNGLAATRAGNAREALLATSPDLAQRVTTAGVEEVQSREDEQIPSPLKLKAADT